MRAHILILIMVTSAMGYSVPFLLKEKPFPLDMAPSSVDDAYTTCTKEMTKMIPKYLQNEKNSNADFKAAWNRAQKTNKHKNPGNGLTEDHAIAIRVYTNGQPKIYDKFNAAVREQKNVYKTAKFIYHALHFLLTDALKHLKEDQGKCETTYRRTNVDFDTNVVKKEIRFGSFTSSSRSRDAAPHFGKKSCFEIRTCHGAALGKYSHLPNEEEVLIPPYEKFKVLSVKKNQWCDVVYSLNSTGTVSNLDCALM